MGLIPRHPRYPLPENYRKDFQKAEQDGKLANATIDYLVKLVRQMDEDYRNIYVAIRGTQYVDRGDPSAWDFIEAVLAMDAAWHDLDLSGIVSKDAKLVNLELRVTHASAGAYIILRSKGVTNNYNSAAIITQVGGVELISDYLVPCGPDGVIQYLVSSAFTYIHIMVRGWWA